MMGMHGESWVNNAIQEADLLIAFGMRFDDRVTGNLASYAPNAKKIHIEIDPSEINKNVRVDVALIGDLKEVLGTLKPLLERKEDPSASFRSDKDASWLREINQSKGTAAVRDIVNLPDNGHLYAAHVINDIWREAVAAGREKRNHYRYRCGPAPDVGGAVLQARGAALAGDLGRPGHDGVCVAGRDRREGRMP